MVHVYVFIYMSICPLKENDFNLDSFISKGKGETGTND